MDVVNKETALKAALTKFSEEKWHCAESVLYGLLKSAGYENPETALSCASGFNGGVGGTGNVCGAISGSVMAAGFLFGRHGVKKHDMAFCKLIAGNVIEGFQRELGTSMCSELTAAYDFGSPERRDYCRNMIETSIEIMCRFLKTHGNDRDEVTSRG